jgi:hypothetical protein
MAPYSRPRRLNCAVLGSDHWSEKRQQRRAQGHLQVPSSDIPFAPVVT